MSPRPIASANRSARKTKLDLDPAALVDLVANTSGVDPRAALSYWAAYSGEVDGWMAAPPERLREVR